MALTFNRLNRNALRRLVLGGQIAEHGIIAHRLRDGDLRFSVNIMVDGVRIHRVIGRESEGVTREQAERAIEALRTKAREGRLDLPAGRKLHRSLAEAANEYLDLMRDTNGKNLKSKARHFSMHILPALGRLRLDKLSDYELRRYRNNREGAGASVATVNRELATLSHLLSQAVRWRWIKAESIPDIPMEPEGRRAVTILDEEQSSALIQAAHSDADPHLSLFVAFGLNAAMRHREILAVRYEHIDFAARRIFIPQAKAGEREQPITVALRDALQRQRERSADCNGWIFPSLNPMQSKFGHRTNMARPFARAVVRAGLDPQRVTPHTMRHTAITRLVRAGVDLPTIQSISGHKTLAMVLRYTHVHGLHIDAGIAALNRAMPITVTRDLHTP